MLTCLSRDRDADDLAWTALEDQNIPDTDEVAGDGDGVPRVAVGFISHFPARYTAASTAATTTADIDVHVNVDIFAVVTVAWAMDRMYNILRYAPGAVTERMILPLIVVIPHTFFVKMASSFSGDVDVYVYVSCVAVTDFSRGEFARIGGFVLPAAGFAVGFVERGCAFAVVALDDVDVCVEVDLVVSVSVSAVVVYVDIDVCAAAAAAVKRVLSAEPLKGNVEWEEVKDQPIPILANVNINVNVNVFSATSAITILLSHTDGFAGIAVVRVLLSIFPSSALDGDLLVGLDFGRA